MTNVKTNEFENQVRRLSNREDVMEIIDRIVNTEKDQAIYLPDEALAAVFHSFYYIRPYEGGKQFFDKMLALIKKYGSKAKKMYVSKKQGLPYEVWLWGEIARQAIIIARDLFDKEYYDAIRGFFELEKEYGFPDFRTYINDLNDCDAECIFYLLTMFKSEFNVLFSDENYRSMWSEIENRCVEVGWNVSDLYQHYDEHVNTIEEHKSLLFHYLGREQMIDIIFKYLDTDSAVLRYMERVLHNTTIDDSCEYMMFALAMQNIFDLDIFDPIITDLSKLNTEALELEARKIFKKGTHKDMMSIVSIKE